MTNLDQPASDTKPKVPAGLREAINTTQPKWNVPEPSRPTGLLGDDEPPPGRCLLSLLVIGATSCLCAAVVALSALAGYGDELDNIQTKEANNRAVEIGTQYALAVQNEAQGALELARDRYIFIETKQPGYGDVQPHLTQIALVLSATPTPSPSPTATSTPTPTVEISPAASPTPETSQAEEYFNNAQDYMLGGLYEETIEWLDAVIAVDPTYRRFEVDRMLVDALISQAGIYFAGVNNGSNGLEGNQLARGITFVERAKTISAANPDILSSDTELKRRADNASFTAFVVNGYLTAQAYLAGGLTAQALTILQELYALPSDWGYAGVKISDLIIQAGGTPGS
ncbi:MAG: hypothetical protein HY862_10790 [Chloroflexi bacterium]|nr:hypothetical protein [Chloroflexota bacterium]